MFVFLPAGACGLVRCGCCRRKAQGRADGTIIHVLRGNVKRGGTPAAWKYIKSAGVQTNAHRQGPAGRAFRRPTAGLSGRAHKGRSTPSAGNLPAQGEAPRAARRGSSTSACQSYPASPSPGRVVFRYAGTYSYTRERPGGGLGSPTSERVPKSKKWPEGHFFDASAYCALTSFQSVVSPT